MAGSHLLPVPEVGARIVREVSDKGTFWAPSLEGLFWAPLLGPPLGPPLGPGGALQGSGPGGAPTNT